MQDERGDAEDFLMRVAWLYYEENLTQADIAEALGVSRSTVVRALGEARERGLVRIELVHPLFNVCTVERQLKTSFGLQDAVVVPAPPEYTESNLWRALGRAGALYLRRHLRDGTVLGTAWGATLFHVARNAGGRKLRDFSVVMLLGGHTAAMQSMNPSEIARLMAEAYGGTCYPLYVPAVVSSSAIRDALLSDHGIRTNLELAKSVQIALVGIGSTSDDSSVVRSGVVSPEQVSLLRLRGAVGDICYRYFDLDGRPVRSELDDRVIGIDLEDLTRIPRVVAVAGGPKKVRSILGALRGGFVDVLITDDTTARRVLQEHLSAGVQARPTTAARSVGQGGSGRGKTRIGLPSGPGVPAS
ncbi:MAG: sugar-binding transcriptional regulator [Limnochordaceae bacterium]|nr:sugar-binding transcriptional regulator [Limnochordaceae bacterium]